MKKRGSENPQYAFGLKRIESIFIEVELENYIRRFNKPQNQHKNERKEKTPVESYFFCFSQRI